MSKSALKRAPEYRTPAQLKADASALAGRHALAPVAAADETPPPPDGTVGELWLYGVVGGWWRGFDAESVANALRSMDVDTLHVRIHSPGGIARDGVAISNLLRNHRARIVVVIDGLAASAASVIAIAGDEIIMCPGSQMMIHDASVGTWGNAAQLRRDADVIDRLSDNYASVYAYKAGGTTQQWREAMLANEGEGTWYTAEEAIAAGLADRVGTLTATSSPPVAPEDEFDEGDDEMVARAAHDLALLERAVHPAARAAWQGERHKPPTASAGGSVTTEGGSAVAFSDEQLTTMRDTLELPADADESAILAAVQAVVAESLEERPAPAAGLPEGHVPVAQARLETLESNAAAGAEALKKLHAMERTDFLDSNKAKYPTALRDAWAKQYDLDPEAARKAMAEAPDLIPTEEVGHAESPTANDAVYASVWGPDEKED